MIEYSNLNETFITFIIKRFPELKGIKRAS